MLYVPAQPNDYEPLRIPVANVVPTLGRAPSPNGCHHPLVQQLQETFDDTLGLVARTHLRELVIGEDMWGLEWSDITVCTNESNQQQLYYHMHPIILEVCPLVMIISFSMLLPA